MNTAIARSLGAALALVLATASLDALATAQFADKIVYDGKVHMLHTNPMEAFFTEHPDKKPSGGTMSSALWRGYVATFEVRDGCLVLKDIEVMEYIKGKRGWLSVLSDVVPRGQVLKIDWFTGLLVIPVGEVVNYVHMGYGSTFSEYILLEIRSGKLTGERRYDREQYERFKEKQFEAFKKTRDYREAAAKLKKKNGFPEESVDPLLRDRIISLSPGFLVDEEPLPEAAPGGEGAASSGNCQGPGGGGPAVRGVVKSAAPTVSGYLDAATVSRAVRRKLGAIKACYETQLKKNPEIEGRIKVKFSVGGNCVFDRKGLTKGSKGSLDGPNGKGS